MPSEAFQYWSMFGVHLALVLIVCRLSWQMNLIWKWYKKEKGME